MTTKVQEIWKDVVGYEGLYQVSNIGRVRSINFKGSGCTRIRKQDISNNGYARVDLWKDRNGKHFLVHRLVASAFIPNDNNLPEVNHKNECQLDNRVENLEWCDRRYNLCYGTRVRKVLDAYKRIGFSKAEKAVLQFTKQGELVAEYISASEASRKTGISQGHISSCCLGRKGRRSIGGYIWKYKQ